MLAKEAVMVTFNFQFDTIINWEENLSEELSRLDCSVVISMEITFFVCFVLF